MRGREEAGFGERVENGERDGLAHDPGALLEVDNGSRVGGPVRVRRGLEGAWLETVSKMWI